MLVSSKIKCISTLFDLLQIQHMATWCNSTKRLARSFVILLGCLQGTLLPQNYYLVFQTLFLGVLFLEFHNLDRVELITSSSNIYKHVLHLTISSVLKQRIFILCFVHFFGLICLLFIICGLESRGDNVLMLYLLIWSRLKSNSDDHITGA